MIARRYLASRKDVSLITAISGISVAGMAVGVASLIVVLSVMNGFYDVVRDLLVSLDPHVRIVSADGSGIPVAADTTEAYHLEALTGLARSLPHVDEVSPYVEGKALLLHAGGNETNRVVIVRGVDTDTLTVGVGRFRLGRQDDTPGIVLGYGLGQRLGLVPGDGHVALLSAQGMERMLTRLFGALPVTRFSVRGLYQLQDTYDNTHVFIGLEEAQRLFRMPDAVSGMELRLDDLGHATVVKQQLQRALGPRDYVVQTWYDLQRSLYEVMRLEKWGASLIFILISVVAAFNIVGALTMVVIQKRRDVGVLQAMGASRRHVRQIFLLEGALIGGLGAGIGFGIGLSVVWLQKTFQLVPLLGAESFMIDAYPVSIRVLDLSAIGIVGFGLCVLASLYPALRAAKADPASAVQMDR